VGYAYAVAGRRPEAEKILDQLEQLSHERWVNPMDVATIYSGLGDRERAFEWLEKAYRERSTWLIYLNVDRFWDPIRSDPRFADLVRRVGLPARPK
jgi:tetratricopeptide (TPR) repeat protein